MTVEIRNGWKVPWCHSLPCACKRFRTPCRTIQTLSARRHYLSDITNLSVPRGRRAMTGLTLAEARVRLDERYCQTDDSGDTSTLLGQVWHDCNSDNIMARIMPCLELHALRVHKMYMKRESRTS